MGIEVDSEGKRVYETEGKEDKISVIEVATNQVVTTFRFGHKDPHGLALVPGTSLALVSNRGSANISVIDLDTNEELTTIPTQGRPDIIAVSPDGKRAYLTSRVGKSVQVIDVPARKVVATIKLGGDPHGIAFRPAGKRNPCGY